MARRIDMPYAFVARNLALFRNDLSGESPEVVESAVLDVVEYTLYHELAHALIHLLELPVLGHEEDAADDLATLLSIELVENGAEMALAMADMMSLELEQQGDIQAQDFWGDHALNEQRIFRIECLVYGSDTK